MNVVVDTSSCSMGFSRYIPARLCRGRNFHRPTMVGFDEHFRFWLSAILRYAKIGGIVLQSGPKLEIIVLQFVLPCVSAL